MTSSAGTDQPLAGLRIVLTRPREQAGDFEAVVRSLGGEPVIAPAIAIAPPASWQPLDAALDRIDEFDWIAFTSANAVKALTDRGRARGVSSARLARRRLGAVGSATATVLAQEVRHPDVIADASSGEGLGEALAVGPGDQVLVPQGDLAGGALARVLRRRGAQPTEVVVYRTVPGEGIPWIVDGLRQGTIDALLFASGSAARFVADALNAASGTDRRSGTPLRSAIFCIGSSTASAAASAGLTPDGVADAATQSALIEAMMRWFAARRSRSA